MDNYREKIAIILKISFRPFYVKQKFLKPSFITRTSKVSKKLQNYIKEYPKQNV